MVLLYAVFSCCSNHQKNIKHLWLLLKKPIQRFQTLFQTHLLYNILWVNTSRSELSPLWQLRSYSSKTSCEFQGLFFNQMSTNLSSNIRWIVEKTNYPNSQKLSNTKRKINRKQWHEFSKRKTNIKYRYQMGYPCTLWTNFQYHHLPVGVFFFNLSNSKVKNLVPF